MRKIFLNKDENNRVNWNEDCKKQLKVRFIYDDIEGFVVLKKYEKKGQKIYFEYKNKNYCMKTSNFRACQLGYVVGKINKDFKYNIGEVVSTVNENTFKIITQERKNNTNEKVYQCQCSKCNKISSKTESQLNKKVSSCRYCCKFSKIVTQGLNDIATTHPNIINFLKNKDDAYKYSYGSETEIDFICPFCNSTYKMSPNRFYNHFFSKNEIFRCPKCSDGISSNEKYIYQALSQALSSMNIRIKMQKSFKWSEKRKYDFYIKELNIIIEVHGPQHYKEFYDKKNISFINRETGKPITYEEQKNIDDKKRDNAIKNMLKNEPDKYIIINASKTSLSNHEQIKQQLISNKYLSDYFKNFDEASWNECELSSSKTMIEEVEKLYLQGITSPKELSAILNLSLSTINTYLNWLDQNLENFKYRKRNEIIEQNKKNCRYLFENNKTKEEIAAELDIGIATVKKYLKELGLIYQKRTRQKRILCIELGKEFSSVVKCAKELTDTTGIDFKANGISRVCTGVRDKYKGFTFKYI